MTSPDSVAASSSHIDWRGFEMLTCALMGGSNQEISFKHPDFSLALSVFSPHQPRPSSSRFEAGYEVCLWVFSAEGLNPPHSLQIMCG